MSTSSETNNSQIIPAISSARTFAISLIAGGAAGTCTDIALFPIDTLKTRLQAAEGFVKAGGFRGVYSGLSAAAAGSAPGAALFFSTYDTSKRILSEKFPEPSQAPLIHMSSASIGEMGACLVRVPTEIVKQRMQTGIYSNASKAVSTIFAKEGIRGLYTGYFSLIAREIPFSFIQFPIYEAFKVKWSKYQGSQVNAFQGAICGSIAGGIAASITTPLDVVKTRLMLGKDANGRKYTTMISTFKRIYSEEGPRTLLSGIGPRTLWITIGGFVFFGVYEKVSLSLKQ